MKYKILSDGQVIASFVNASDRDLCLTTLRETYDDCVFESRDD